MPNTDIQVNEVSPLRNHFHHISQQPIDRHLIEVTDEHKSVFINAGIDSTCGKKRASIIHIFMKGTIISSNTISPTSVLTDNLLDSLTCNHSAELESREESSAPVCCSHCGK